MNTKKLLVWLLTLCLLLMSFSACGNKNKTPNQEEETTDAPIDTTPVEIEDAGVDFWVQNNAGFDNAVLGDAADFEIDDSNGTVTILSYKGAQEHLVIPSVINGLPVTAIADGAFAVVEEEKKEEGEEENQETTAETTQEEPPKEEPQFLLKTLIIPDSVTAIGIGILAGCKTLHSLETPLLGANKESKQYLGYLFGAPRHEDNPRDIPASLKCLRLTGEWQSLSAYALFDCNDLICVSFPETLTVIEKFALFNCASLKQIDGLDRIVTFGDRALMDCSDLQIVTLSNTLETVGFGTFEGCTSIRALTLPFVGSTRTENTYLAYIFGAAQPDFAKGFYPKNLARITLTETCQTLGNYAFFECESLKEITLSEGLTSIGVRAFYGCTSLWRIKLPNTVTTVRELAFANCDALSTIDFGQGLTSIGINAFYNCDSLTEISLPQSLKSLPASCFAGCISLTKVDLGGVTDVGAQAFRHCNAITTVTAQGKVTFGEGNDSVEAVLNSK